MTKNDDDLMSVTEFITASRENLEIASVVFDQYEVARGRILQAFFDRLGSRLTCESPDWSYEYDPKLFVEPYGRFSIWKKSWRGGIYRIVIEAYNRGERMIGGIWRDESLLKGVPRNPEILSAVKSIHPRDRCISRGWYEAEVTLRTPVSDWRQPEAIWRILRDASFLDEVEGLFTEWRKIAETLVDASVARHVKAMKAFS